MHSATSWMILNLKKYPSRIASVCWWTLNTAIVKNNRQKRLIRNAGFDQPEANIMDINYTSGRKLNKNLINRLATCEYISEHRNLFITGATGCGKTYMACAFGMEACKQYFNTKYVRLPDLLIDLEMAATKKLWLSMPIPLS